MFVMSLASPDFSVRSYQAIAAAHAHPHAQAVLPLFGAMGIEVADRRGRVADRVGVLIPPHALHRFSVDGPNRFIVVDFAAREQCGDFFAVDGELAHLLAYARELSARARLAADVQRHAGALLADAVRCRVAPVLRPTDPVQRALALIEQQFAQRLCVADIAAAAGLSASHLQAEFRRQLGKTPAQHLAEVRLSAAIERLRAGVEPIAQIALACGYSEQSALNRALRRRFGTTPGAVRRS